MAGYLEWSWRILLEDPEADAKSLPQPLPPAPLQVGAESLFALQSSLKLFCCLLKLASCSAQFMTELHDECTTLIGNSAPISYVVHGNDPLQAARRKLPDCAKYHASVLSRPSDKEVLARNPNNSQARETSRRRRGWPSG